MDKDNQLKIQDRNSSVGGSSLGQKKLNVESFSPHQYNSTVVVKSYQTDTKVEGFNTSNNLQKILHRTQTSAMATRRF